MIRGYQIYKMFSPKFWFKASLLGLFILLLTLPVFAQELVAKINGQEISKEFYNKTLKAAIIDMQKTSGPTLEVETLSLLRTKVLDQIIDANLILQGASNEGLEVEEKEIKERIKEVKEKFPESEVFHESLAEQGLSVEDLIWNLRAQLLKEKLKQL